MKKQLILLVLSIILPAAAAAINVEFLKDSVMSKMSKQDISHFEAALGDALNKLPDGGKMRWSNPESNAEGIIAVDATYAQGEYHCRKTRLRSRKGEIKGVGGKWDFCKTDDGWKIAP